MDRKQFAKYFLTIIHIALMLIIGMKLFDRIESVWGPLFVYTWIVLGAAAGTLLIFHEGFGLWFARFFYLIILTPMIVHLFTCLKPWLSQGSHGLWHTTQTLLAILFVALPLPQLFRFEYRAKPNKSLN